MGDRRQTSENIAAVTARGLGKRYRIAGEDASHWWSNLLGKSYSALRQRDFWAVRDLDLSVKQGTFLGIVGANGSGKSTLLKMIAGIIQPSVGDLSVTGRVAALIEVGVGFHPDLNGWENIFLYGSVLGIGRAVIRERLGAIAAFAGLEGRFLDMPMKYYSSGMRARLGFSVAVNTEPDVLLVDEVLSVGDAEFQDRSFERIMALRAEGRTVILVTHDIFMAREICDEMIWMDQGRLKAQGAPDTVVSTYQTEMAERAIRGAMAASGLTAGESAVRLLRAAAGDDRGEAGRDRALTPGSRAWMEWRIEASRPVDALHCVVYIIRSDGMASAELDSEETGGPGAIPAGDSATIRIDLDPLVLREGVYWAGAVFYEGPGREQVLGWFPEALTFHVTAPKIMNHPLLAHLPAQWRHEATAQPPGAAEPNV